MFNYSGPTHYARESNLMYRVYAWMCLALSITAATAYYVSTSPTISAMIFRNPVLPWVLIIAQLGLVLILSTMIARMSFEMALGLFLLYSFSVGLSLSVLFIAYTLPSLVSTFLVASGMFGAMALYGYYTKADLTSMGSYLFMAVIGLVIAGVVNIFLKSDSFQTMISGVGVLVFTLLTAYDVQRIKYLLEQSLGDRETMSKATLMGALALYLDFINLFLYLLQFMGRRRD